MWKKQALAVRRHNSEQIDADPLVWTNQRFIKWARSIDLAEYAENLKGKLIKLGWFNEDTIIFFLYFLDSGVHGALVVLEPSFTAETLATALGIPPAKLVRRHLATNFEALVLPARYSVYRPEIGLDNNSTHWDSDDFWRDSFFYFWMNFHSPRWALF